MRSSPPLATPATDAYLLGYGHGCAPRHGARHRGDRGRPVVLPPSPVRRRSTAATEWSLLVQVKTASSITLPFGSSASADKAERVPQGTDRGRCRRHGDHAHLLGYGHGCAPRHGARHRGDRGRPVVLPPSPVRRRSPAATERSLLVQATATLAMTLAVLVPDFGRRTARSRPARSVGPWRGLR